MSTLPTPTHQSDAVLIKILFGGRNWQDDSELSMGELANQTWISQNIFLEVWNLKFPDIDFWDFHEAASIKAVIIPERGKTDRGTKYETATNRLRQSFSLSTAELNGKTI